MKKRNLRLLQRLGAWLLAVCMLASMVPAAAAQEFADAETVLREQVRQLEQEAEETGAEYDGYLVKLKDSPAVFSAMDADDVPADGSDVVSADTVDGAIAQYGAQSIEYMEPNYAVYALDTNDPYYAKYQWNLETLKVPAVWDMGLEGSSMADTDPIIVAVIDSGINYDHEDLDASHILIDDGYNWATNDREDVKDALGHGTFCSAQIMATRNNGMGIAGITPEVWILPLRVFGTTGKGYTSDIVAAIQYATNYTYKGRHVDVISMSLGGESASSAQKQACDAAVDAGILVVAAAGNDGDTTLNYPAAFDSVIGVGSVGTASSHTEVSDFSQRGLSNVFVTAPGYQIVSAYYDASNSYYRGNGTSFACPEVAALGALCKSIDRSFDQNEFKNLLIDTSTDLGAAGRDADYGYGLVDFEKALTELLSASGGLADEGTVQFRTEDLDGNLIEGASLTIQPADGTGEAVTLSGSGSHTFPKGRYTYTATAKHYLQKTGEFSVYTAKRSLRIVLDGEPYPVTVTPKNTAGDTLYDALITVRNSKNVKQTETSFGSYSLPAGSYTYSISATNYYTQTGSFTVEPETGASIDVTLYGDIDVASAKLSVQKEDGTAASGVSVKIYNADGGEVTVYGDGYYKFYPGTYTYKAESVDFKTETGEFTITEAQKGTKITIPIVMHDPILWVYFQIVPIQAEVTVLDAEKAVVEPYAPGEYRLLKGSYTYRVSAADYETAEGEFTLTTAGRTIDLELAESAGDGRVLVTFVSGGGTSVPPQRVAPGELAQEPEAPTRTGYTFDGWYQEAALTTKWDFSVNRVTAATTLYAKWVPAEYRIIYMFDGEELTGLTPETCRYGTAVRTLPTPEIPGYHFEGWYRDEQLTQKADMIPASNAADVVLYASCTEDQGVYTIQFDAQGGSETADTEASKETSYLVTEPAAPAKRGYTFLGWFTDAQGGTEWDFKQDKASWHMTLYAHWQANTYKIYYRDNTQELNGLQPETYTYGQAVMTLPTPEAPDGKRFDGWYKDEALAIRVRSIPTGSLGEITLYVKWSEGITGVPDDCDYEKGEYETDYNGDGYPDVSEDGYTLLYTQEQLEKLRDDCCTSAEARARNSAGTLPKYRLAKSILLTGEWEPIGNSSAYFCGELDGAGHTIAGLLLQGASNNQGLFGAAYYATIENLTLAGTVSGTSSVGGFVGSGYYTSFINLKNYVNVTGAGASCGGIAGDMTGGVFKRCVNYGDVSVDGQAVTTATSVRAVGGILGSSSGSDGVAIDRCVNYGDITNATGTPTGGILGTTMSIDSAVTNCYNRGSVSQTGAGTKHLYATAAGIVGFFRQKAEVSGCYNTGKISSAKIASGSSVVVDEQKFMALEAAIAFYQQESLPSTAVRNHYLADVCPSGLSIGRLSVESDLDYVWVYPLSTDGGFAYSAEHDYAQLIEDLGADIYGPDTDGTVNGGYPAFTWQLRSEIPLTIHIKNSVTGNAMSVELYLDGEPAGSGSDLTVEAPEGLHRFELRAAGENEGYFEPLTGVVYLSGDSVAITAGLEPVTHTLTLRVTPQDAPLTLTHEALGTIEPDSAENGVYTFTLANSVAAGAAYTWTLSAYGYETQSGQALALEDEDKTVTLTQAAHTEIYFDLAPADVDAQITLLDASGTQIAPDQPRHYRLPDGKYTYEIRAEGYYTQTGTITLPGSKTTISITLKLNTGWDGSSVDTSWYDASGTEFHIATAEAFAGVSQLAKSGETFEGKTIYLDADIELGGRGWTPIGAYDYNHKKEFRGTLDGQGHTIRGLKISSGEKIGLFGGLYLATVRDLTLYGTVTSDKNYIGALAGYVYDSEIADITSYVDVTTTGYIAGAIAGKVLNAKSAEKTTLKRCVNYGSITVSQNKDWVGTKTYAVGGLIGVVEASSTSAYKVTLQACANHGAVEGRVQNVGGLVGYSSGSLELINCLNTGAVTGQASVSNAGGFVGSVTSSYNTSIGQCVNLGTVTNPAAGDEKSVAGAIMGAQSSKCTLADNYYLDGSAKVPVGGKEEQAGCQRFGSTEGQTVVDALKDSFVLDENGLPALLWTKNTTAFKVQFDVTYDTEANQSTEYALIYSVTGNSETYLVGKDGSLMLPRGTYQYSVDRMGYEAAAGEFTVSTEAKTIPVELKAERYALTLHYAPESASVLVTDTDGAQLTPSQAENGEAVFHVVNGTYTCTLSAYGYTTQTEQVEISYRPAEKKLSIQPLPAYDVRFTVSGTELAPENAEIRIYAGTQRVAVVKPGEAVTLPTGAYTYSVHASGYVTYSGTLQLTASMTVQVELQKKETADAEADTDWYTSAPDAAEYTIRNEEELRGLAKLVNEDKQSFVGKTIRLGTSIDVSGSAWTPIGSWSGTRFSGTFDGGGSSVTFTNGQMSGSEICFGLFGYLENARVQDLILRGDLNVTAKNGGSSTVVYVGALSGYATGTSVSRVSNQTTLTVTGQFSASGVLDVGGLLGWTGSVTLDACSNAGAVTASCTSANGGAAIVNAGGLVGLTNCMPSAPAAIANCYNIGSVTASSDYMSKAAGILGSLSSSGSAFRMQSCYNAGTITAGTASAALTAADTISGTVRNCFYLAGTAASKVGTSKTAAELQSAELIELLGSAYIWQQDAYPALSWERTLKTLTVEQQPEKTAYLDLEDFEDLGMVLRAAYSDGTEERIVSGWLVQDGTALRVDRKGAVKTSDGVYQVPVTISFRGMTTQVMVTVTQRVHEIPASAMQLDIPAPQEGQTAKPLTIKNEYFTGTVTWTHAGEPFTGKFERGEFYRAAITLTAVSAEGALYQAFPSNAAPRADGMLEARAKTRSKDGKTLTAQLTYPAAGVAASGIDQKSLHLYYEGESGLRYDYAALLDQELTLSNGSQTRGYTLRELETRMLSGSGAQYDYVCYDGKTRKTRTITGLNLYTLLCESGVFPADLSDDAALTLNGTTLTWGQLRETGGAYNAAGQLEKDGLPSLLAVAENGAPLIKSTLFTVALAQQSADDENAARWAQKVETITLSADARAKQHPLRFQITDGQGTALDGYTITLLDKYGNAIKPQADGSYLLTEGLEYAYRVELAGYGTKIGTTGVIRGETMLPLMLRKTWDGQLTEPERGEDGYYLIYTAQELMWFNRNGKNADNVRLMADITLNSDGETTNLWQPMFTSETQTGAYTGTFDGNGHTIENLCIRLENLYTIIVGWDGSPMLVSTRTDVAGMFGYVSGTIKNLGVTGSFEIVDRPVSQLADWFMLGGIAGFLMNGTVSGCWTDIAMRYTVGQEKTTTGGYPDCSFPESCDVYIGGIAGSMSGGLIENCYALGDISASGTRTLNLGGIAGGMRNTAATVKYCYSDCAIRAQGSDLYSGSFQSALGGIVGNAAALADSQGGTITGCFALGGKIDGMDGKRVQANRVVGAGDSAKLSYNSANEAMQIVNVTSHEEGNYLRSSVSGANIALSAAKASLKPFTAIGWSIEVWRSDSADTLPRLLWQRYEAPVADCEIHFVMADPSIGTVTPTFTGGVTDGKTTTASTVSFRLTPPGGWKIASVTCQNGKLTSAGGYYTIRDILGDLTITVTLEKLIGDVNADGVIDVIDAMLILRHAVLRHAVQKLTLTADQLTRADLDGNGKVDVQDALLALRLALGIPLPSAQA